MKAFVCEVYNKPVCPQITWTYFEAHLQTDQNNAFTEWNVNYTLCLFNVIGLRPSCCYSQFLKCFIPSIFIFYSTSLIFYLLITMLSWNVSLNDILALFVHMTCTLYRVMRFVIKKYNRGIIVPFVKQIILARILEWHAIS